MSVHRTLLAVAAAAAVAAPLAAQQSTQTLPPARDPRIDTLVGQVSAERLQASLEKLVSFGTRNTLSDTTSRTRGIGAARHWIKAQFDSISKACGGCLEVSYEQKVFTGRRSPQGVNVVDVVAVLKGTADPNRYVAITGHYDSRVTNVLNDTSDAPGANDDGSGAMAVVEAARVLSHYRFPASIAFGALAGEEQGLYGGQLMAERAKEAGWNVEADLNNDIIGNIHGEDGVVDNTHVRVFSESPAANTTLEELRRMRVFGGEVDSPSREIARYIDGVAGAYLTNLDVMMIYRLDRFGRGGDHRAFNDAGFAAVRFTEPNENYTRQHQDIRVANGIHYGDVLSGVDFPYLAKVTALNVASLASLAWAPAPPDSARVAGAVRPSTTLRWKPGSDADLAGYKVYWRDTTSPTWDHWRWAGKTDRFVLEDIPVDNYFFGVAAVSRTGEESPVVWPLPGRF